MCAYVFILCQTSDGRPGDVSDSFTLVSSIEDLPDDGQTSAASLDRHSRLSDSVPVEHSGPLVDSELVQQHSASPGNVLSNDHKQVCLCIFLFFFFFCEDCKLYIRDVKVLLVLRSPEFGVFIQDLKSPKIGHRA